MAGVAAALRAGGLPSVAVLAMAGVLGLGGTLLLVRVAPRAFLGADGLWMLQQVGQVVSGFRAPKAPASRRVMVELVGPAGAGKSTVADVLRSRDDTLRASIWGLPVGVVSRGAVSLLPTFLPLCLASRRVPWQEMKQMIRLAALQRFLARAATPRHRLIVLDEGPVFVLSWLQVFGAGRFARGASYQRWARRTLVAWAALLDLVVVLDAPDPVLTHRIRSRAKPHWGKDQSDQEIAAFIASCRAAFASVLADLTTVNGTKQLTVRAEFERPEAVATRVLQSVELLLT